MLISLSGLPGTGKTTVARLAAAALRAVYLRIDSIEEPMLHAGFDVEGVGYEAAQAIAADNLSIGGIVIADCVNPWPLTRNAWRDVASRADARLVEVEFVCSDVAEHQRRIDARRAADRRGPTWQDVLERDYRPWDRSRTVIDTASVSPATAADILVRVSAPRDPRRPVS